MCTHLVFVRCYCGRLHRLVPMKDLITIIAETPKTESCSLCQSASFKLILRQTCLTDSWRFACLLACDSSMENWVFNRTVTVPNIGYLPSLYYLSMLLFSGPSRINEPIWWAHVFILHYFCYPEYVLVILQEHRDLQEHDSKWLVWYYDSR